MAKSTKKRKKRQSKKIKIIKIIILSIILILLIAGGIYAGPKIVTVIQLANDAKRIADESTIDTFKDYYLWTPEVKPVYPDLCLYILYIHH